MSNLEVTNRERTECCHSIWKDGATAAPAGWAGPWFSASRELRKPQARGVPAPLGRAAPLPPATAFRAFLLPGRVPASQAERRFGLWPS